LVKALAIPGLTTDADLQWLAERAAQHACIVEIGAYQGRSTRALADATPGVVYAIDNWRGVPSRPGVSGASIRRACRRHLRDLLETKVHVVEHDSQCGLPAALRGVSVDMLWIDGDHDYESVASDLRTFAPLVRTGGQICGHDYNVWHPDVVRAVDEAYGARVQTISIHRSIWWVTA
jgi:predicted O-methyltransferase YrrM